MRRASCYFCNESDADVLFAQEGYDPYLALVLDGEATTTMNWVVCRTCGFVYRSPKLDDSELKRLYERYEENVFEDVDPDEYFDRIVSLPPEESENQQKVTWLKGALESSRDIPPGGLRVLDIGCGGGTLAFTLADTVAVRELCGVELNQAYAELARRRLGADIRNESYESGLFDGRFDLLVCTKVLEHVDDPLPFLHEMYEDTDEGRHLFIEVPDILDMFTLPPDHERFYIPHIYFFSRGTLSELLGRAGFSVVECRTVTTARGRAYLQMLAKKSDRNVRTPPPFDSPEEIAERVARNLRDHERHGERR